MKKVSLLLLLGFLSVLLLPAHSAYAHVLIRDTAGNRGAILHIIPDDDPIAGKKATLFFDMQNDTKKISKVTLGITQEGSNETVPIKAKLDGSLATANFTFPSQGVYLLKYEVKATDETYTFEQSTRIARGVIVGSLDKPRYAWAEALLIGCGVAFGVLVILAFNRRSEIAKQSTF